jgi:hypothetical protein
MAWAAAITEKANQISEVPVLLWRTFASPQANMLAWSTAVENLTVLEATSDKLAADDAYLSLVAEGAKHASTGSLTDSVTELIHADRDVDPAHLRYVTAASATAAEGSMTRVVEVGVEIAKLIKTVTGCPTSFGVALTGPYGTFQWSTYFGSIEELEEASRKIRTDSSLAKLFEGDARQVFVQNTAQQTIVCRIL